MATDPPFTAALFNTKTLSLKDALTTTIFSSVCVAAMIAMAPPLDDSVPAPGAGFGAPKPATLRVNVEDATLMFTLLFGATNKSPPPFAMDEQDVMAMLCKFSALLVAEEVTNIPPPPPGPREELFEKLDARMASTNFEPPVAFQCRPPPDCPMPPEIDAALMSRKPTPPDATEGGADLTQNNPQSGA
jgi:hypothetical protein